MGGCVCLGFFFCPIVSLVLGVVIILFQFTVQRVLCHVFYASTRDFILMLMDIVASLTFPQP